MIVFTITNSITNQIYVGTCREELERRWEVILKAAEAGLDEPLYHDIREHGADNFVLLDWAVAEDTAELRELMQLALEETGGQSLQGLKMKLPKVARARKSKAVSDDLTRDALLKLEEQGSELVEELDVVHADKASTSLGSDEAITQESNTAESIATPSSAVLSQAKVPVDKSTAKVSSDAVLGSAEKPVRAFDKAAYEAAQDAKILARIAKEKAAAKEMALLIARMDARGKKPKKAAAKKKPPATSQSVTSGSKAAVDKLATGRVGSAVQERKIREAIALEKDARLEQKLAQQKEEAAEMAAIIARLDSRAKKPKKAAAKKTTPKKTAIKPSKDALVKEVTSKALPKDELNVVQPKPQLLDVSTVECAANVNPQSSTLESIQQANAPVAASSCLPAVESKSDMDSTSNAVAQTLDTACFSATGKPVVVSSRKKLSLKRRSVSAQEHPASPARQRSVSPLPENSIVGHSDRAEQIVCVNKTTSSIQQDVPVEHKVRVTQGVDHSPATQTLTQFSETLEKPSAQPLVSQASESESKRLREAQQRLMEQFTGQDTQTTEMAKLIAKVAARKAASNVSKVRLSKASKGVEQQSERDVRLRQLVAQEKAKRQSQAQRSSSVKSDEMAVVMARLEEKRAKCRQP